MPERLSNISSAAYDVNLFELLKAYGNIQVRGETAALNIVSTRLFSVDEAIARLKKLLGNIPDWETLSRFLPTDLQNELLTRSALASTFAASLELVKEGYIELRQEYTYGAIYLRQREALK